jgi:anti-sigma regulatory factor (Ser/Thr protein kinase)
MAEAVTTQSGGADRPDLPPRARCASITLDGEPRDVQLARAHARSVLGSIPPAAAEDVLVVVNELVSNAVQHGVGPVTVAITLEPSEVVVAVTDHGPGTPSFRQPTLEDEGGRGLRIVQRLTATWDVERAGDAKTITTVVRLESSLDEAARVRRRSSGR